MARRSFDDVITILHQRRMQDSTLIRAMIDVRDRYNGDVVIPLPDVDGEPTSAPSSARIVSDGIDGLAMQAASPRATISCPARKNTDSAMRVADQRRRALYASWHHSALWDIKLYRSYRHLTGYGTNAFVVLPDFDDGRARVEIRDPLTAYPELRAADDIRTPLNVGFIFGRSIDWIKKCYPVESAPLLEKAKGRSWDTLWDLVEWIDEDEIIIGVLGPRQPAYGSQDSRNLGYYGTELSRYPNKAGLCPSVVPRRVTLDRIIGQMQQIVPMQDLLDRLTALDIIAAEKAIFPDMVALGKDGRPPAIISGPWKDGRTGEINLLTDSDIKVLQSAPGPLTHPVLDRVERAARMSSGASPMFGGQTTPGGGSLRTGAAIAALSGFSVDPRTEEVQKIMARALSSVNDAIGAVEKGYFSGKKIFGYTGWATDESVIEYDPADVFADTLNVVNYQFPGSDVANISVTVGQMVGAEIMSKSTGRRKHPFVEDADQEEKLIVKETVQKAVLESFLAQGQQGALPLIDGARIYELLDGGKSLVEAIQTADDEAKARQAKQAPAPEPGQEQQGAPEAQPGLASPGMGAESQPPATIGPPQAGQQNLRKLISALNAGRSL